MEVGVRLAATGLIESVVRDYNIESPKFADGSVNIISITVAVIHVVRMFINQAEVKFYFQLRTLNWRFSIDPRYFCYQWLGI